MVQWCSGVVFHRGVRITELPSGSNNLLICPLSIITYCHQIIPGYIVSWCQVCARVEGARGEGRGARGEGRGARGEGRGARGEGRGARGEGRGARGEGRGARGEGRGQISPQWLNHSKTD